MKLVISAALVLGFGLTLAGCGTTFGCKDLCAEANKCPGATQENCDTSCADIDAMNKATSCTSSYDSFMTCVGDHKDLICSIESNDTTCQAEALAYVACALVYCQNHTTDPACTGSGF